LCSREACRIFESLGEYRGASDEKLVEGLRNVIEWLFETNGNPDDDLSLALEMVKRATEQAGRDNTSG